jgi:hypothetical protein
VEQHLLELSTYLGHVKVSDTYWYTHRISNFGSHP